MLYGALGRLFPSRPLTITPRRIVLILPCCIGDVVMSTATLTALRRGFPDAHITFAVGAWSLPAVERHPDADAILNLGAGANPERRPLALARTLQGGGYDLAVSLVRSPLMSFAVWRSGIPHRAGLDSGGRGFGYTVRVPVQPEIPRHEARIYLDVAAALGVATAGIYPNVPYAASDAEAVQKRIPAGEYVVINPAGGANPGMVFSAKRWPPSYFAQLADALADAFGVGVVIVAGADDAPIVAAMRDAMRQPSTALVGELTFGQIAALADGARAYIGNDTGLTHLAAAAGARTVMILGPSDPARYAPYAESALALWKPVPLRAGGVAGADVTAWDWVRDGIGVPAVIERVSAFLRADGG